MKRYVTGITNVNTHYPRRSPVSAFHLLPAIVIFHHFRYVPAEKEWQRVINSSQQPPNQNLAFLRNTYTYTRNSLYLSLSGSKATQALAPSSTLSV